MTDTALFLLFALPGTVFLACNDVLVKKLLSRGIPERILLGIIASTVGFLALAVLLVRGFPDIKEGFWLALIVTASLNIFAQWFWFKAFQREDLSLIAPMRLLAPPITILTGFLFLGEVPSAVGAIGIAVTITGLLLLTGAPLSFTSIRVRSRSFVGSGLWYALLGATSFGITFPLDKQVVVTSSPLMLVAGVFIVMGTANLLWAAIADRHTSPGAVLSRSWWLIGFTALIFFTSLLFNYQALNYALAAYASTVRRLSALWAVIFGGAFLKEHDVKRRLVATAIMFLGVAITVALG